MKKDNKTKNNFRNKNNLNHSSFYRIEKEIEEDVDMDNLVDYLISDDYPFKDNI